MDREYFSGNELGDISSLLLTEPFTVNEILGIAEHIRTAYIRNNLPPFFKDASDSIKPYLEQLNSFLGSRIFESTSATLYSSVCKEEESFGFDLRKLLLLREVMVKPDEKDVLASMLHDEAYDVIDLYLKLDIRGDGLREKLFRRKETEELKRKIQFTVESYQKYREHINHEYPGLFDKIEAFDWGTVGAELNKSELNKDSTKTYLIYWSSILTYMDYLVGDILFFDVCNIFFDHGSITPFGYAKFNPKLEFSIESPHKVGDIVL